MTDDTAKKPPVDVNAAAFKTAVDHKPPKPEAEKPVPVRRKFEDLPPAAQRALMEAEARRKERDALRESADRPKEIGGRGGLDPSRYDDYEIDGRAIDF